MKSRQRISAYHPVLLCVLVGQLISTDSIAKPRPPLPPWPEWSLYLWRFNEPYVLRTWADSGKEPPVDDSIWVESWSGYALNRQGQVLKPVGLPMATPEQWNLAPQEGAVRFWFKPDWSSGSTLSGSGPGHYARLMELTTGDKKDSVVWWSIYVSPDGNTLHFSGQDEDGPTDLLSAEIQWTAGEWHLVSVSYGQEETWLQLDGMLAAMGEGIAGVPIPLVELTTLVVGTDVSGRNAAGGQFEELAAFDHMLPAWNWDLYYHGTRDAVARGPISPEEEAASIQKLAELKALQEAGLLNTGPVEGSPLFLESMGEGFFLLTPQISDTNVILTLLGAETNKSYNILFSDVLPAVNWSTASIGTMGQTNFIILLSSQIGFYQAAEGDDWDGDGIKNWEDAQPSNTNVGILTVTIEMPANGSTID